MAIPPRKEIDMLGEYSYPMDEALRAHLVECGFSPEDAPYELREEWRGFPIVDCILDYLKRSSCQ